MLSKVSSTTFWVFGMTRLEIEPRSPGPLAITLPMDRFWYEIKKKTGWGYVVTFLKIMLICLPKTFIKLPQTGLWLCRLSQRDDNLNLLRLITQLNYKVNIAYFIKFDLSAFFNLPRTDKIGNEGENKCPFLEVCHRDPKAFLESPDVTGLRPCARLPR